MVPGKVTKIKKIFTAVICCFIIGLIIIILHESNSNNKLMLEEIKTTFKHRVSLDCPVDNIAKIKIGGVVSMPDCDSYEKGIYTYEKKQHITQIADYLNNIPITNSSKEKLPNLSSDASVQYFDGEGKMLKNFLIYGEFFIEDTISKKTYRVKGDGAEIITGLEKIEFE